MPSICIQTPRARYRDVLRLVSWVLKMDGSIRGLGIMVKNMQFDYPNRSCLFNSGYNGSHGQELAGIVPVSFLRSLRLGLPLAVPVVKVHVHADCSLSASDLIIESRDLVLASVERRQ